MGINTERRKKKTIRVWIGGIILLFISSFGFWFLYDKQETTNANETKSKIKELNDGPMVKIILAGMSGADKGQTLIGEARPYQSVTLYAKTSGYMSKIYVDKGDKVKQGQLLATIVSQEIDQAYNAALADLNNKKKIAERDQMLLKKEYISKEEAETSATAVAIVEAQVKSLKEQMAYKNIIAPFSGTITARFADPGALVQNATNSQISSQPIVAVAQLDKIRIYVYISQTDASRLKIGTPVTLTMTEKPGFKEQASLTRITGELDPKTRMMLAEIDISNQDNQIIPGSYLQVNFPAQEQKNLTIPSEALVIRNGKYFVPLIIKNQVHYQPVSVESNNGVHVSILNGIKKGDTLGVNVSAELQEGHRVRIQS